MTIRSKINDLFSAYPGTKMTAVKIAREIGEHKHIASSILTRMADKGELQRRAWRGPRGGYVYFRKADWR